MDSYYIIKNELNKYYVNIHKNKNKYNILVGGCLYHGYYKE